MSLREKKATRAATRDFCETNDCSVIALAHATSGEYSKAHAALAAHGRIRRHGARISTILMALMTLGYEATPVCQYPKQANGSHYTRKTLRKLMADRDGAYLVVSAVHISAWVYGEDFDNAAAGRQRIHHVYKVTRKGRKF